MRRLGQTKTTFFLLITITLASCQNGSFGSANPGDAEKGQCSLNCGKAIIGSNSSPDTKFKLEPVQTSAAISCRDTDTQAPGRAQFIATETDPDENVRPVPFLSMNIVSTGITTIDAAGTITDNIITSPEERCTDTCGIFTVDYLVTCPGDYNASIYVHSGPLKSAVHTISVTNISTGE